MKSRKILLVEDNKDGCEMLRMLLTLHSHVVEAVYDGITAIEYIKWFQPEVILIDIGLPRMNGWEVAQHLRNHGDNTTKIYALTGYGDLADIERSKESGINHHFTKPLNLQDLWRVMQSHGLD